MKRCMHLIRTFTSLLDVMLSGANGWVSIVFPDESILEDVELFADLSSCIGLGGETAVGGGPTRLAVT